MKEKLFSLTKKDFEIQTFKSGGKGGQHQNKTDSGVRIIHLETGLVGECRTTRSQFQNKKIAFQRLTQNPKFQIWIKRKAFEKINNLNLEDKVEKMMNPSNIKIEIKNSKNQWIEKIN
jgi:protein subunit release factor A